MATVTPRLYPRQITVEPTPEQQQADYARSCRKALHRELHGLFSLADKMIEETFGGKMNYPPERSESETGCSLTPPFLAWLETHQLPDPVEARRCRQLWQALTRLQANRRDLWLIVETHARTDTPFRVLARTWRASNKTLSEGYAEGLDLMIGFLGEAE